MSHVQIACQVLLALVFCVSAVSKVRGRAAFDGFVTAVRRLAPRWAVGSAPAVRRLSVALVLAEAGTVLLLLVPGWSRAGLAAAALLLAAFSAAVARVLRADERVACRCFGASAVPLRPVHLVRNLVLLAAAVVGLAPALASVPLPEPGAVAASAAAGAFGGLLVVLIDDIVLLFSPLVPRSATPHDRVRRRADRPRRSAVPAEPPAHRRRDPAPEGAHRPHRGTAFLGLRRTSPDHAPGR
ncbi:MauE/DoxX family redox-associated membrane protein [Nocardiopsis aegyptia]|uniref:MauE/DoxX family redox-associated membrane protein n=1 Tax=Nocardiopsis aegyptia TaxID=220378 RepID=UPI00366A79D4